VTWFNLDRRLYELAGCLPAMPGSFAAFRREALTDVGGVSADTMSEDTDLTMALLRAGWDVAFQEEAIAWTGAPASVGRLCRQRFRRFYGTIQVIWKHRRSILMSGRPGRLGRRGLPCLLVFQVLPLLLDPLVDVFAVSALLVGDPWKATVIWLGFLATQIIESWYAFALGREPRRALWGLPLQRLASRQLIYPVLFRSATAAAGRTRLRWHRVPRAAS
jgi:cellulose synthase/poly-beta-1,6-N-acetylglucosamine synthase-like glycosyltransferase